MAACRREWGLRWRGMPATVAILVTIVGVAAVDRLARDRSKQESPGCALAAAGFQDAEDGHGERHGGRLVALADQVKHSVASQGLGVVLDPHRRGFGRSERIDAEQIRQGTVVDCEGLSDLEEPDEFEPVQSLGSGLVAVDFWESRVDGWVGPDEAVNVGEPEEASHRVHHRDD